MPLYWALILRQYAQYSQQNFHVTSRVVDSDYDTNGTDTEDEKTIENEVVETVEKNSDEVEEVELNVQEPNLVQSVQAEASEEETEKLEASENEQKVEQVKQAKSVEKVEAEVAKDSGNNSPTSEGEDFFHWIFATKTAKIPL